MLGGSGSFLGFGVGRPVSRDRGGPGRGVLSCGPVRGGVAPEVRPVVLVRRRTLHAQARGGCPGGRPSGVKAVVPAPGAAVHRPSVQRVDTGTDLGAPGCRAVVVVAGPRQIEAEGVALLLGGGRGKRTPQFREPFGGIALFAQHDVEPVAESVTTARPCVVRGEGGGVQGPGPLGLPRRRPVTVLGAQILEDGLHDVPGRYLPAVQAGPHPVGVALPEHTAPAAALVEPGQQAGEVLRELPYLVRELFHCHCVHPTPDRSTPIWQKTPFVLRTYYDEFSTWTQSAVTTPERQSRSPRGERCNQLRRDR